MLRKSGVSVFYSEQLETLQLSVPGSNPDPPVTTLHPIR